jgi:hypothetical protein
LDISKFIGGDCTAAVVFCLEERVDITGQVFIGRICQLFGLLRGGVVWAGNVYDGRDSDTEAFHDWSPFSEAMNRWPVDSGRRGANPGGD